MGRRRRRRPAAPSRASTSPRSSPPPSSWPTPRASPRCRCASVAERLGQSAMSLYTYVPGKAELLDLMLDTRLRRAAGAAYPPTTAGGPPPRRRRVTAGTFYQRHPWVLQVSAAAPVLGPHELDGYEAPAAHLRRPRPAGGRGRPLGERRRRLRPRRGQGGLRRPRRRAGHRASATTTGGTPARRCSTSWSATCGRRATRSSTRLERRAGLRPGRPPRRLHSRTPCATPSTRSSSACNACSTASPPTSPSVVRRRSSLATRLGAASVTVADAARSPRGSRWSKSSEADGGCWSPTRPARRASRTGRQIRPSGVLGGVAARSGRDAAQFGDWPRSRPVRVRREGRTRRATPAPPASRASSTTPGAAAVRGISRPSVRVVIGRGRRCRALRGQTSPSVHVRWVRLHGHDAAHRPRQRLPPRARRAVRRRALGRRRGPRRRDAARPRRAHR